MSKKDHKWAKDDVTGVLMSPVYTMGSPTVDGDTWIRAQKRLLDELGPDEYFSKMLEVIHSTFGEFVG